jgi:mono/diheme cytochrome c family protein
MGDYILAGIICGSCHERTLDDGQFGPALRGSTFNMNWAGGTVGDLIQYMSMRMPPAAPGSLSTVAYAQFATYILQQGHMTYASIWFELKLMD